MIYHLTNFAHNCSDKIEFMSSICTYFCQLLAAQGIVFFTCYVTQYFKVMISRLYIHYQIKLAIRIMIIYMNKIDSYLAKHVNLYSVCDFGSSRIMDRSEIVSIDAKVAMYRVLYTYVTNDQSLNLPFIKESDIEQNETS